MSLTTLTARGVLENGSLPVNYVPSVQSLHLAVGTDGQVVVNVIGSNGVAIDLTGCACVLAIKQNEGDLTPLISRLGIVTDAAGGIVAFGFTANDSIPLGAGAYVYDVLVTLSDGTIAQVVPSSPWVFDANPGVGDIMPTVQLPTQQGQSGKVLGTNGTNLRWTNVTGNFHWAGDWVSGTAYAVNDVAYDAGYGSYICTTAIDPSNTAPHADSSHWQLLAADGPAGPAPAGGAEGDLIAQNSGGDPEWQTPFQAVRTAKGGASLPANTWVELARLAPGVNKIGYIDIQGRGATNKPSKLSIWGQVAYRTDSAGNVYLQATALAPIGGAVPTYAGSLKPAAPTGLAGTPTPGQVELTFTPGARTDGCFAEISTDGGVTWTRIVPSPYSLPGGTTLDVLVDNSTVPASTAVKFRVVAFNEFGEQPSSAIDVTTDTAGQPGSFAQPVAPNFPVASVTWTDLYPAWVNLVTQPEGSPSIELVLVPDGTDLVLKAHTTSVSYAGGVAFRMDCTLGPSI